MTFFSHRPFYDSAIQYYTDYFYFLFFKHLHVGLYPL